MKVLRTESVVVDCGTIPITLSTEGKSYVIDIDGVEWIVTQNRTHAVVMFEMMLEHITEYMCYKLTDR